MEKTNTLEVEEKIITLRSYYDSLPHYERRSLVHLLCQKLEVSEATAYNWIMGRNKPIKASYFRILSEITGIPAENLFPND